MPRKLLIIDNSIAFTGAFKCALTEATLLQDEYEVFYILPTNAQLDTYFEGKQITLLKLPLLEINKSIPRLLRYFPQLLINGYRLRKIVRKNNIEIVQVNDFYNLLGVLLRISGSKAKLITYVRFLPKALPAVLSKTWSYLACRYAHRVVCVSDAVVQQMPAADHVIRIYDPLVFKESHGKLARTGPDGQVVFTYVGNYIPGKGHNFAMEAFHKAYLVNPMIRLQFAGGDMGMEKNRVYRQSLESSVAALGLTDAVRFLPFVKDIEQLIKQSDVMLNFSEAESFSMTCAEASYYGRPVIASRCGGPEEIVDHGKSGLLVGNRDVPSMTAAMLQMAALSNDERETMGDNGRLYVKEKFSRNKFMQAFSEAVE